MLMKHMLVMVVVTVIDVSCISSVCISIADLPWYAIKKWHKRQTSQKLHNYQQYIIFCSLEKLDRTLVYL